MSADKEKVSIEFRLEGFEVLSYSYQKPEDDVSKEELNYDIKFRFGGDPETNEFSVDFKIIIRFREDEELGSIKTRTTFVITDLNRFMSSEGEFNLPKELSITLLSISFSTTRGALVVKSEGNLLSKNILPLINPRELYTSIEKQNKQRNKSKM